MNASSIIILIILAVLLFFAIRYLMKNGTCGACPDKGSCHKRYLGGCDSDVTKKLKETQHYDNQTLQDKNVLIDDIIKKHKL